MTVLDYFAENADALWCPRCKGLLQVHTERVQCSSCRQEYPITDHIPQLFWRKDWTSNQTDVTETIKAFYEKTPFPNYDDFDDVASLIQKSRQGVFARLLDEQIPYGARVLDCGCGTGQLSNFLSIAHRTVFGVDMCLNSLRLGQAFKEQNDLKRVHFLQMNIFTPIFRPESFHVVISNGVLHHTGDPFLAFQTLVPLVKPGGYFLVGLYHKYGRLFTDFRRQVFHLSNDGFKFLDRRLLDGRLSEAKKAAWFADQYKNPHESKHTIGEVLGWFEQTGLQFIKSIPKSVPWSRFSEQERLFVPERPGNGLERFLVEFPQMFTGSGEGGFFIMIGRKSGNA